MTVAVPLRSRPDRRAAGEHQGPALDDSQQRHAVRHRAAGRVDLRARPAGGERPDRAPARTRHRRDDRRTTRTAASTARRSSNYQAGALEQRVLHMQTADPLRTPTYTLFPMPDYFFGDDRARTSASTPRFAWDHGYYSPNIDITWAGVRRSRGGRARRRRTGSRPAATSPTIRTRRNTVPAGEHASAPGSRRPICARRCCTSPDCTDDYQTDGRVISQVLSSPASSLRDTEALAAAYQQINSSVGQFATDTLIADSCGSRQRFRQQRLGLPERAGPAAPSRR